MEKYHITLLNQFTQKRINKDPKANYIFSIHSKETTLTAWFNLNKTDTAAQKYFYREIPNHLNPTHGN